LKFPAGVAGIAPIRRRYRRRKRLAYLEDTRSITAAGGARVGDFIALLKPKVMSLVVFTVLVGMFLAPGGVNPIIATISILCIAVGAGASGALNMWYDADIDAVMSRTLNRPIPSGRVDRQDALALGLILSGFSVMMLGLTANWVAAGLLAFTIFFYVVIYTMWLKRSTPQNIVIGGAAGAFPPMVGWAVVTGGIDASSMLLFLIIFLWTPPHFWALALYKQSDYGAAGIPMMPNVKGEAHTKLEIVIYSVLLVGSTLLPQWTGLAGPVYTILAIVTGIWFLVLAVRLFRAEGVAMKKLGRKLFTYSSAYLFVIFLAFILDHALRLGGLA
jgi:protoheme IX farnesyltransferase